MKRRHFHEMVRLIGMFLMLVTALPTQAIGIDQPMHPGALAHTLDRLSHTLRVLYVAAHPDDENTRLLAYLANARHVTVAYLSLTRGEGGQNLIGAEQGDLLGVIRTQELLAARRLDGALQRFTRVRDFGYSKRADETLALWGHEAALADIVWVVRTFQPDVIITRYDEHPPNHGHHTASAILAREAFTASADPARFPEQLRLGVTPWRTDRLLHNLWRAGAKSTDTLTIDVGDYDARLGMSYGELAARSRSQHKSQGFGTAGARGPLLESFVPISGTRPTKDIFEGLASGWDRFGEAGIVLAQAFEEARARLERDAPERALPSLMKAHRALEALPREPRTRDAQAALDALVAAVAGVFVRATAPTSAALPDTPLPVSVEVVMRRPASMTLKRVVFAGADAVTLNAKLRINEKNELSREVMASKQENLLWPSWLRAPEAIKSPEDEHVWSGHPNVPPPFSVDVELMVGDRTIRVNAPVQYAWTDRVLGERTQLVTLTPPATITPARKTTMLPNGAPTRVTLRVRSGKDELKASVRLPVPAGWTVSPVKTRVELAKPGDEALLHFEVTAPPAAAAVSLTPEVIVDGRTWSSREDVIDYPHVPVQRVLQPAGIRVVPLSIRLPRGLVGYVPGSGDTVMEDLAHIGVRVQRIDDEALRSGDLNAYGAIVLGIRAFNTRDVLRIAHDRLMRYVEQGGTLVVQYNTQNRWSRLAAPIAPYALTIGSDRVTNENAELVPIEPVHPVLNTPNRIGQQDFAGWVQERGLYFGASWDPRFTPVFRVSDPAEPPVLGSLLVASYGKGRYIYTGLSFFRQLPAGVAGAYRLLANLIGE